MTGLERTGDGDRAAGFRGSARLAVKLVFLLAVCLNRAICVLTADIAMFFSLMCFECKRLRRGMLESDPSGDAARPEQKPGFAKAVECGKEPLTKGGLEDVSDAASENPAQHEPMAKRPDRSVGSAPNATKINARPDAELARCRASLNVSLAADRRVQDTTLG